MKKFISIQFLIFSFILMGYAQWPSDPMENLVLSNASGEQAIPKVATSVNGITYVAWFSNESGNYDVMLQKLDVYGNKLWQENGILISNHPAMTWLTEWDMTVDYEDHAILTFQDIRNSGNNDVFAYRISPEGEFIWGEDGIGMSTGPAFDVSPKVCVTNANNACFAWQAEDVIILQKISPDGNKLWGESGITLSGSNTFSWPQLMAVGDDDVILKYFDDSGNFPALTRHVFAQRFDSMGAAVWANDAIVSNAGGITAWSEILSIINDGNDGLYIVWDDDRDNNMLASTYIQHISEEGELLLGTNGTEVSTMMGRNHFYPYVVMPEGSDDVFVYWNEQDGNQNLRGIYGQKISSTGERLWTDNGKSIIEISQNHVLPFSVSQAGENMVVFFDASIDVISSKVKAMCLDTDGDFVWENDMVELSSVASAKVHIDAGNLLIDQWVVTWEDDRNGSNDIYAQNIQLDGALGPVVISGDFEIHPDSLVFDVSEPLSLTLKNNTSEAVTIEELELGGYCFFDEDPPTLPYIINSGDSLILTIMHDMVVEFPDEYIVDYLYITTNEGFYEVAIYIDEYLIGNVSDINSSNISISPNPSSSYVKFEFENLNAGMLNITDQAGKIIQTFNLDGNSSFTWDGKNENNQKVKAGTYFYQLISGEILETGKIVLL